MQRATQDDGDGGRLAALLRARSSQILEAWTEQMRIHGSDRGLEWSVLVNHMPAILEDIARRMAPSTPSTADRDRLEILGHVHALDRLSHGFELGDVVTEFRLLRKAIARSAAGISHGISFEELETLDLAIDDIVRQAVVQYARSREKLLRGLNEVSEAAARTTDLDSFLEGLLHATVHTLACVDTAVVLVREDDLLHVRAAVGLEEELRSRFSLRMGEGFAGRVALLGKPVELRDAANDPLVMSPMVRARGVKALYGVPLLQAGEAIGVAHIGSTTADEFSDENKLLFRTMASRAASFVAKARLQARLERAEAVQRMLARVSSDLAQSLDVEVALSKLAHAAVPTIADGCFVDLLTESGVQRVSMAHREPDKLAIALDIASRYPPDLGAATPIGRALRNGTVEFEPSLHAGGLAKMASDSRHLMLLQALDVASFIIAPIHAANRVAGAITFVVGAARRLTERDIAVAEELSRRAALAIENARLYSEARTAVEMREKILAIVSHDLRNELASVMSSSAVLKRLVLMESDPRCASAVGMLERAAVNMKRLVQDLVDAAAIRSGRLTILPEPMDVSTLLASVAEAHAEVARETGVDLQVHACPGELRVSWDRVRMHQLLSNLVGNAIRHCGRGSRVVMSCGLDGEWVRLRVADDGPGIAQEQQAELFQPFTAMNRSGRAGTGLGLFIARGIAERHGGTLQLQSVAGEGAAFTVRLPASPV